MGRALRAGGAVVLALAVAIAASSAASAAPGQRSGRYGTVTLPPAAAITVAPGFPSATWTTTDPAPGAPAGETMPATTPPGAIYGTSAGAAPLAFHSTATSTVTTIAFASATPVTSWSFVINDVDAESLTLVASGPGGPLSGAELGFQSAFNRTGAGDQPTWTEATGTLAGNIGDTTGAAAWFSPTAPITTLTITSTRISATGNPVAYVWLVGHVASLAGVVQDAAGTPVAGATVTVTDPAGQPLPGGSPTATSDATGAYDIPEVFPQDVQVVVTAPDRAAGTPIAVSPQPVPIVPDPGAGETAPAYPDPVVALAGALLPVAPPVTPPGAPAPSATDPRLAATGVDAGPALPGALLLLAGGAALALVGRRRPLGMPRPRSSSRLAGHPSVRNERRVARTR